MNKEIDLSEQKRQSYRGDRNGCVKVWNQEHLQHHIDSDGHGEEVVYELDRNCQYWRWYPNFALAKHLVHVD